MLQEKVLVNYNFKILSFLAIIFVVCGHSNTGFLTIDWLFPYDSFHMPLFVFISGYFFKENTHFLKFVGRKTKRLIIPYFLWNLAYGFLTLFLRNNSIFQINIGMKLSFDSLFLRPFILGDSFGLNNPSWFIIALFFVEVFHFLIYKAISFSIGKAKKKNFMDGIIFLITLCIGAGGILLAQSNSQFILKTALSRIMYLIFWYEAGSLYKRHLEKKDTISNVKYFSVVFVIQILLTTICGIKQTCAIVYNGTYPNNAILTILIAANGIALWLRVSKILTPILKNNRFVLFISNHTFSIMMHHLFIFMCINIPFLVIHKLGYLRNFDIKTFSTTNNYIYLPFNSPYIKLLYVVAGICCPCLVVYLYLKIKDAIKNRVNHNANKVNSI